MPLRASPEALAAQARRLYAEQVAKGLTPLVQAVIDRARELLDRPSEYGAQQRRRDLFQGLGSRSQDWLRTMVAGVRQVLQDGVAVTRTGTLSGPGGPREALTLVSDDAIDLEIVTSRLALAVMDRASWEFSDLRSRISHLEGRADLDAQDMLRAHVLARVVFEAWREVGLSLEGWREVQSSLHEELALLVEEAYHEVNHWLVQHGVLQDVDLRPFIRRSTAHPSAVMGGPGGIAFSPSQMQGTAGRGPVLRRHEDDGSVEQTRQMTRQAPLARSREAAEAMLGRLNRLVARHAPEFAASTHAQAWAGGGAPGVSPGLAHAIQNAEQGIRRRLTEAAVGDLGVHTAPVALDGLQQHKQQLKLAAATHEERATIEIVALLFQSILTEDRIPASVRVWFARLQMPVLRVAVSEPDFFATMDHPARRLIDRMGACVMGFDSGGSVGEALEKEVKRVVQVVEAYPDTGRRVFQTVLVEFEQFLEHYFRTENETTRRGVSLAQQVEQRETLAIQYTIELRRMLNEVPVQEGVRQFLFHVWADVLATAAVRFGAQSGPTKVMKRAAADLIWSAGAKVTRDERAEVIRRLPALLKTLREGMFSAGMDGERQEEHIRSLNNSLAAAFTAKAAVIPDERLRELMERLETLEELLPDAGDLDIDESMVLDLSGHQSDELEVVLDGGVTPTPAMQAWARELQVGSWFMLTRQGRTDALQLVWHGLRKQLSLLVTPQGRALLFPQQRLAAYLQGGLLQPAQDEALTVRATRHALAKLDVDAGALLG